jgi:hypothetical protein
MSSVPKLAIAMRRAVHQRLAQRVEGALAELW